MTIRRYRPLPVEVYGARSIEYPLLQTRLGIGRTTKKNTEAINDNDASLRELSPLERLLRCEAEPAHAAIADALWAAEDHVHATEMLIILATTMLATWESEWVAKDDPEHGSADARG